ncbi:acid protease B [Metarhizium guizhouense ARSEF 977]|uniref:Acid protease B n=1 Tax=Metarhizium guizhouense (strain ARSEF 977) TaxID=1276136 RepID=A0A0B4GJ92_METGA|nr:acid protease B [Metarhizium guizhouense ARSEF 977]
MKLSAISVAASIPSVLAAPGPERPSDRLAARQVQQPWAGAVQQGQGFNYVTGTRRGSASTGSVAGGILQTGLSFYGDGAVVPWYEWWPAPSYEYARPAFRASPGDEVRMSVHAWSATSGNATLENLSTGQVVAREFYGQAPLCGTDADFVLEDFGDYTGGHVPLANFGQIDIWNTWAYGSSGWVDAEGASIVRLSLVDEGRIGQGVDDFAAERDAGLYVKGLLGRG